MTFAIEIFGATDHERMDIFMQVPARLYPQDSKRFALKDSIQHPYLHCCMLLFTNGKPAGRLAVYTNPHLQVDQSKAACIGLYECIDDHNGAMLLLNAAKHEARSCGSRWLVGPMNGSTWDAYRFSLNHVEPFFFLEPFHHLYYNDQFGSNGFTPAAEYVSHIDTALVHDEPAILKLEQTLIARGMRIRSIRVNELEKELELLYDFLCITFRDNFLYTPIPKAEFINKYMALKAVMHPEFVLFAEDGDQSITGLFFALPDLANPESKGAVVKTVARLPGREWSGVTHVLNNQFLRYASREKFNYIVHAFMHSANASSNISRKFAGKDLKHYALYKCRV